ncbi:MAG: hypothetical protein K0U68_08260 [Gammaproteobacteria bacterium]|nr:hypothetical protein [Gammaproteobacteria bacterium]
MNDQDTINSTESSNTRSHHLLEDVFLVILILLTMLGIYISDIASFDQFGTADIDGYLYWMIMIFVFAISAMLISLVQSKHKMIDFKHILVEQSLHWFGAILALFGVLLLVHAGSLSHESAALVFLLVLSLATYLDGIRIGWRFGLIGNYLGLAAVILAYSDNAMWILYLIAIAMIIAVFFVDRKRKLSKPLDQAEAPTE